MSYKQREDELTGETEKHEAEEEPFVDRNSMLFWHPKTVCLPIPQPTTIIVELEKPRELFATIDGDYTCLEPYQDQIDEAGRALGFPLFLRTDQTSGKHGWNDTCFVKDRESLNWNIQNLIEHNEMAGFLGLNYQALVFREYIPMRSKFKAFYGRLPVNVERRYFVEGDEIICHHPYWPEESIKSPSIDGWKLALAGMNMENDPEVKHLSYYAKLIGAVLPGRWSVDFSASMQGRWYFIDMAVAGDSWHWPECPHIDDLKETPELVGEFDPSVSEFLDSRIKETKDDPEDDSKKIDGAILEQTEKAMGCDFEGDGHDE